MTTTLDLYQISNFTNSARDTTSDLNYGSQEMKFEKDGMWRGKLSQYLQMNGEKPALKIPMTDTELWTDGFFQIEIVIKRDPILQTTVLMWSSVSNQGLRFYTNSVYNDTLMQLLLFDGSSYISLDTPIDENPHHIVFTVNATDAYVTVDGVDSPIQTHSFAPSGLSFADSVRPAPTGELRLFKIHKEFKDPTVLYTDAIKNGYFGDVRSLGEINLGSFEYAPTDETGIRYIKNRGVL